MMHKSGYVNIVGYPNVGKSTLMNALMGDRLSIITSKPQTTRHRILGILNEENYQIIFSDTPGVIDDPSYSMQEAMNRMAFSVFEDADILILLTDPYDKYSGEERIFHYLKKRDFPVFLVINKMDLVSEERMESVLEHWNNIFKADKVFTISAQDKMGLEDLIKAITDHLPEGPAYYPKDQLSDRNYRFFVSEIIREKILQQFKQEVPYSCEVVVDEYDENEEKITRIHASIYVDRKSQKSILIGKGGSAIKKLGIASRESIEAFIDNKVFLELQVKVKDNWRDDDRMLKHFGYKH
ncbi:MAG: GTPase Era [Saprospiraceae bacterium]|nr:GTPase Era [Saprospiraceae bacterium]